MSNLERLINIMARLRGPSGCPWDKEQTPQSLKPYLIEEAYEVLEAIDRNDDSEIKEELGDLLLQVVFHAQIASEENRFTIDDVAEAIADKLIRRHPHVFGDTQADTPDEVIRNWEAIKAEEKPDKRASLLDGVPQHLPALLKARRLQEKAARVGFEWEHIADVAQKVREETEELMHARESGRKDPGRIWRLAICPGQSRSISSNMSRRSPHTNQQKISIALSVHRNRTVQAGQNTP